jgi:DNA-binding transcriptional LysR family regulator
MTIKKIPLQALDWDDVRVFLAIARTGSISGAARSLRLDHSTVSRRLGQLELSLGGPLFERRPTALHPTDSAAKLRAYAEAMEAAALGLREAMAGERGGVAGTVRLAMMEGIGSMYVARRLEPLLARHPALKIELVTSAHPVSVSRREADVFLSFFKPEGRGLDSRAAGSFALGLYGADSYFARHGRPASADELPQHQFVGYIEDLIQVDAVRWLDEVVRSPTMAFRSNSMLAQMTAAAAGTGLVLLPHFAVTQEPLLRPVLADAVSVKRELWINVQRDLSHSARIRVVADYLAQLLAGEEAFLHRAPERT